MKEQGLAIQEPLGRVMSDPGNRHKVIPISRTMSRWEFKGFPTSKIELLKNNQLKIEHGNKEIESDIVSFGKNRISEIQNLLKETTINFEILFSENGKTGRESEKFWLGKKHQPKLSVEENQPKLSVEENQPKLSVEEKMRLKMIKAKQQQKAQLELEHNRIAQEQLRFREEEKISKSEQLMIDIKPEYSTTGLRKTELREIFKPKLLDTLKLEPNIMFRTLINWNTPKMARILNVKPTFARSKIGYYAEILLAWYDSIVNDSITESNKHTGLIINETTNVFFGMSPGLPQFVVKDDGEQEIIGAIAIGIVVTFHSFHKDEGGRVKPDCVISPLPNYPGRVISAPYPVIIGQKNAEQQIFEAITDDEGNLDVSKFPMSLVAMKNTEFTPNGWDYAGKQEESARKNFIKIIKSLSSTMGFEIQEEDHKLTSRWKNTYEYLLTWCLVFQSNEPPESVEPEKGAKFIQEFPLYSPPKAKLRDRNFTFCWFHAARGRVHDAALEYIVQSWKQKRRNRWLLLGDETGGGRELVKGSKLSGRKKKFAYIWVLIPPKTFPPPIASDFHAMDQHMFSEEHIAALSNIIETPDIGLTTVIFEADDFIDIDQKLPTGNVSPSPSLIKATLPMMLEFIAQNTQSKNKENCEIEVTAEEWGWHSNTAIEPSNFLKDHARITLDNIQRRDGGNFLIDIPPPLAKKDHPFLNYADAIGFLVGDDSIPNMLEEYKEKLNQFIHVLPIYPAFLESEFPKLCEDLATKPLKFIEALIETNTQHVSAYFKFVLSGMVEQAWAQFKPLDWRQFNHLMERKQSTANGRKISAHLSNWILPNLSQHLESLLSDADRVNMCLTIAWSMDQQGGDVSQIIEHISPEWLSTCPLDSREKFTLSLARVCFASRQNYFDFSTATPELLNLGIIPESIDSPGKLQKILSETNTLTENKASILGIFFSTFAFQNSTNPEHVESLWNTNSFLVSFPWEKARENRRHCIYGAEFAIDCAISSGDENWFEHAKQRLYVDFDQYLSSGEDRRDEPFWWPVALKYHCLMAKSSASSLTVKDASEFSNKAKKVVREGPLPVRIRASYWMARLSRVLDLCDGIEYFAELESYVESDEYPKNDVYGALLYVHLIDLEQRFGFETEHNFTELFNAALADSNESTRLHFSEFLQTNDMNIIDSLCYNYL